MNRPQQPTRKVAILGTEPSSLQNAPVAPGTNWEVWGCAPLWSMLERHGVEWDAWFELHSIDYLARRGDRDEHIQWMRQEHGPEQVIYCQEQDRAKIPNGVDYPLEVILETFPSRYFTNTISWMLALAIYQQVDKIGLWGVDMSLGSEYGHQRPSCEYFIGLARGMGIEVIVPPECSLLKTRFLYGFDDDEEWQRKIEARRQNLQQQKQQAKQAVRQAEKQLAAVEGAQEDLDYWEMNWEARPRAESAGDL